MNNKIRDITWILGLNVAFLVLLVLFAANRELGDPMMSIVIPMLIVTSGALIYTLYFDGDLVIAMSAVLLLETGQMTQVLINEGVSSMPKILLFVSPIFGAVCVALIAYLGKSSFDDDKKAIKTLCMIAGGVVLISLALMTVGRNINGTRAWLVIGPLSLQLTELFVLFEYGVLFVFAVDPITLVLEHETLRYIPFLCHTSSLLFRRGYDTINR